MRKSISFIAFVFFAAHSTAAANFFSDYDFENVDSITSKTSGESRFLSEEFNALLGVLQSLKSNRGDLGSKWSENADNISSDQKVGIATTSVPSNLQMVINGDFGAAGICDESGGNCTTAAEIVNAMSLSGVAASLIAVPDPAATLASAETADVAFNTTSGQMEIFDGSAWTAVDSTLSESEVDAFVANNGYLNEVAVNSITATELANDINVSTFINDAGYLTDVNSGSISNGQLANNSVTSEKIVDGTIKTADLASDINVSDFVNDAGYLAGISAGLVGNAELANDAVTSAKILDGTITADDLAETYLTEIAANSIGTSQLATDINVSTFVNDAGYLAGISAGSVGNTELANDAVTSAKILDGTVSAADLAETYLTEIAANSISTSQLATDINVSTFVNDAGYLTGIAANSITANELATDVNVSTFVNDAGYFNEILAGSIGTTEISDNAITSAKILNGSVSADDLAETYLTAEADTLDSVAARGATIDSGTFHLDLSADRVGIGVSSGLSEKLEVAGGVKIADSSASTCAASHVGVIQYNSTSRDFEGCVQTGVSPDTFEWKSMTGGLE